MAMIGKTFVKRPVRSAVTGEGLDQLILRRPGERQAGLERKNPECREPGSLRGLPFLPRDIEVECARRGFCAGDAITVT